VPVRKFLAAPAVVVAATDELVPVRVMSSATSPFAQRNDSVGCGRRQQRTRAAGAKAGRPQSLQDLRQNIAPLFRAADRSRPNFGSRFKVGV
jgi:hypothetical protein